MKSSELNHLFQSTKEGIHPPKSALRHHLRSIGRPPVLPRLEEGSFEDAPRFVQPGREDPMYPMWPPLIAYWTTVRSVRFLLVKFEDVQDLLRNLLDLVI